MAERVGILSERVRLVVLAAMTVAILVLINLQISGKERIVRDGTIVLLQLAPVDPRSLLQGDYMALRYAMTSEVSSAAQAAGVSDGRIVIALGENGEARFVALYNDQVLSRDQRLLRFRKRGDAVRIASDAWFFEEGEAGRYREARFGELRVDEHGDAVLTGLRDGQARALD